MLLQFGNGGLDARTVRCEHGLPCGPSAVALGHQPRIGADFPDRHAAGAKVSKKGDPLRVTSAVDAVTARRVALHRGDEPHPFVIPKGVFRQPRSVGELGDGHFKKLAPTRPTRASASTENVVQRNANASTSMRNSGRKSCETCTNVLAGG
jgi:hypothetical protein